MQITTFFVIFLYLLGSIGYFAYMVSQKEKIYNLSQLFMLISLVLHTCLLSYLGIKYKSFPIHNLHEILSVIAWSIIIVFFIVQQKFHLKLLGVYAGFICVLSMVSSFIIPKTLFNNSEIFQNFWLGFHVFSTFLGDAALALACGSGLLYLIQENAIKKKKRGFFFKRLPSLNLLDNTGFACLIVGFPLLSIGLISGSIYANYLWGRFWSWDPKELWSSAAWLIYAVLLHERIAIGLRGRKSAIMAIIGFAVLLFTFLGVNFLLKGHHKTFTAL